MTGIAAASFFSNTCRFGGCGLHFPTLADLIEHIEDNHIGTRIWDFRFKGSVIFPILFLAPYPPLRRKCAMFLFASVHFTAGSVLASCLSGQAKHPAEALPCSRPKLHRIPLLLCDFAITSFTALVLVPGNRKSRPPSTFQATRSWDNITSEKLSAMAWESNRRRPKSLGPALAWETWKKLLAPGFGSAQLQLLQPSGE
nr:juxtaposed with another zinc finger protein 1 isoform X4 [Oryctolagus cuniculus]